MQAVQRSVTRQNKTAPIIFNEAEDTGHTYLSLVHSHFILPAQGGKISTNIMRQLLCIFLLLYFYI